MSYSNVHAVFFAAPAAGDLPGRIRCALTKQAVNVSSTQNKLERQMIEMVYSGTFPSTWTLVVIGVLDSQGKLPAIASITPTLPTDADVDTAAVSSWGFILAGRGLVSQS